MGSTAANLSISVQRFRLPLAMKWGWALLLVGEMPVRELAPRAAAPLGVAIAAWIVFVIYAEVARRPASIEVSARGISIDTGGLFAASSAALGVVEMPSWGVPIGVALTFTQGDLRFCLGGRDHRVWPSARLAAAPVVEVDAWLSFDDFEAALAALASHLAPPGRWEGATTMRAALVPHRARRGIASVVGQTQAPLIVEVDRRVLRVLDAAGRCLASASLAQVAFDRAVHVYRGRGAFNMPIILLRVPGAPPLSIGVPDFRLAWRDAVASTAEPQHVLGAPDWLALLDCFQARSSLEIAARE
jgi:hypothetical protein